MSEAWYKVSESASGIMKNQRPAFWACGWPTTGLHVTNPGLNGCLLPHLRPIRLTGSFRCGTDSDTVSPKCCPLCSAWGIELGCPLEEALLEWEKPLTQETVTPGTTDQAHVEAEPVVGPSGAKHLLLEISFQSAKPTPPHPRLKISLMQSPLPTSSCLFIQKWQLKLSINIVSSVSKDVIQEFPPEYRHSSVQKNTVLTEGAKIIMKKYSCFNPLLSVLM